jgi:hypothetical protein
MLLPFFNIEDVAEDYLIGTTRPGTCSANFTANETTPSGNKHDY